MTIRQATPDDARAIVEIAQSLKLDLSVHPTFLWNGFLVYPLNEEQYKQRIRSTPYFYVDDCSNEGIGITGFLMCYDDETLRKLTQNGDISHQDAEVKYVLEQKKPFIFGDQIGVRKEWARCGSGTELIRRLFGDMGNNGVRDMYVGILQKPVTNNTSIHFCAGFGFDKINEVQNPDETVWGIWKRDGR